MSHFLAAGLLLSLNIRSGLGSFLCSKVLTTQCPWPPPAHKGLAPPSQVSIPFSESILSSSQERMLLKESRTGKIQDCLAPLSNPLLKLVPKMLSLLHTMHFPNPHQVLRKKSHGPTLLLYSASELSRGIPRNGSENSPIIICSLQGPSS